jgi:hypothetical protein
VGCAVTIVLSYLPPLQLFNCSENRNPPPGSKNLLTFIEKEEQQVSLGPWGIIVIGRKKIVWVECTINADRETGCLRRSLMRNNILQDPVESVSRT